jgi:hypothetical protein
LIGKVRVKRIDRKNKKKQKKILVLLNQMNQQVRKLKKISKIKCDYLFSNYYVLLYRLVNEIDEFENDDALTANNISVSSFRSAG